MKPNKNKLFSITGTSDFYVRLKWLITILCLSVIFMWSSYNKISRATSLPFFDASDGTGFYLRDSSFDFRLSKRVADGCASFSHDSAIQYPEGLDIQKYYTPLMNWVSGTIYRLFFKPIPFHVFLIWFISIVSSFTILGVFLTSYALFSSRGAAVFSTLLYALAPASFKDVASGNFVHQDFTLSFIFISFACFVHCFRKDRTSIALIGSLFMVIAQMSWHLTEFYLLLFIGGFVVAYLVRGANNFPRKSFTILTIACFLAAMALPVLRTKLFVFSPGLMVAYALTIALYAFPSQPVDWSFFKKVIPLFCFFFGAGLLIQIASGNQSHVVEIMLAKIRFLGQIPLDPAALSFEARIYWQSGYISPELEDFVSGLGILGLLGALLLLVPLWRIKTGKYRIEEVFILYHICAVLLLFVMFVRFDAFAVFFLALPIGYIFQIKKTLPKPLVYAVVAGIVVLAFLNELRTTVFVPYADEYPYNREMIDFFCQKTDKNDPVLSEISNGGMIAAYTGHPVALHGMFESKRLREKVKEVYTSLFKTEDDFYSVCRKYSVKYFVYQSAMAIGSGPYTMKYFAGVKRLPRESAVALFHFAPEKLKHFQCVYQNPLYRIFRIDERVDTLLSTKPYFPVYDIKLYADTAKLGEFIDDDIITNGLQNIEARFYSKNK